MTYSLKTIRQVLRCVDMYISLAEAETKKEDQQRSIPVPRSARSVRNLELVGAPPGPSRLADLWVELAAEGPLLSSLLGC